MSREEQEKIRHIINKDGELVGSPRYPASVTSWDLYTRFHDTATVSSCLFAYQHCMDDARFSCLLEISPNPHIAPVCLVAEPPETPLRVQHTLEAQVLTVGSLQMHGFHMSL